jgi:hypothetical protein
LVGPDTLITFLRPQNLFGDTLLRYLRNIRQLILGRYEL